MSTAAFALFAAGAALVVAAALAAAMLRSRRTSERRLDDGLLVISERLDELAHELVLTVEKVREDGRRAQIVGSLGQALDLDEVLARSVEAAAALPGVAAAIVDVDIDGVAHSASIGVDNDGGRAGGAGAVGGPPDGSRVRAVGVSYHYAARDTESRVMRSAVAVPLESNGDRLGFLTVFGLDEEPPVAGGDFQILEAIAAHAGPAIVTASQRGNPQRPSEVDALTGLGTRHALHETLALEVARAQRRSRKLAVCIFDLDDFRHLNESVGQLAADRVLAEIAALLRETIRPDDLVFRSGGDEFAVILPESSRIDGEALYARLQGSLGRAPGSSASSTKLSAGIAELMPSDDGVALFERADRALQRAKAAGKGTAA